MSKCRSCGTSDLWVGTEAQDEQPRRKTACLHHRLLAKLDMAGGPDACWPGKGSRMSDGYCQVSIGPHGQARNWRLHRAIYETVVGPIGDLHVLHRCDNRPCGNPTHLFLGTELDNHRDKAAKGRSARGERQHLARLTAERVREIRLSPASCDVLAAAYGVSRTTIKDVRFRRTWRHVEM